MKRILIVLLSIAMLVTFMPMAAFAYTEDTCDDAVVEVKNATFEFEKPTFDKPSARTNNVDSGIVLKSGGTDGEWIMNGGGLRYVYSDGSYATGWFTDGEYYWYLDPSTGFTWTGWHKIDGYWYYFAKDSDENGFSLGQMYDEGIMSVNGKYYYFGWYYGPIAKWGKLLYGWIRETDSEGRVFWVYADSANDGQVAQGWKRINNKWYYFGKLDDETFGSFVMYFGGRYIVNGYYYYFGADGDMKTGWIKESEDYTYEDGSKDTFVYWFYADPNNDSRLAIGWKKINGKWYWFYENGEMFDNDTRTINGKLYAFNRDGSLHEIAGWVDLYEDWIDSSGKKIKESYWVYTDKYGVAKTGWQKISGEWYCFGESGYLYYNEFAYDSKGTMWMDANGRITKSKWILNPYDGEWYYCKANGYIAMNEWTSDSGGWLYMNGEGIILKEGWAKDSTGWCWMNEYGRIAKNAWVDDGKHYVGANGYMYANGVYTIDNVDYTFDETGYGIPIY